MINITHSLWWINLILILISFWIIGDASIWIILLSIFLGQVMDLDLKNAWISKKKGLRSLSRTISFFSSWHRRETHSIFFSMIVAIVLLPLSLYLSIIDWSSLFWNTMVIFWAVFSHAILDMFNLSPIPLFYVPVINPIEKAKLYTYYNFLQNFIWNIWHYLKINWLKEKSNKLLLKGGLLVSSESEFKYVTFPLMVLFIILIITNLEYVQYKIYEWRELIINNVLFSLFIIIFSVKNNYFFKDKWWFKDFVYNILKYSDKPEYWKWWDLLKMFWESNFTKIFTFIIVLTAIAINPTEYLNNWLNFFYSSFEYIKWIFDWEWNIIKKIITFFNYVLF